MYNPEETIVALATPPGQGAIAVVRLSGPAAMSLLQPLVRSLNLSQVKGYRMHFLKLFDGDQVLDEALVSFFRAPKSYTGQDVVEISCHGSGFIVRRLIQLLQEHGARLAQPGEFTQRAFLSGKLDLAQAEAVADLIASETQLAHQSAMHQIRGGLSQQIAGLREKLIHFAALIELELDFGEEDVEFANRLELRQLVEEILATVRTLADSFRLGNAVKNGVSTVIAGKPNAGKSTLLNALLREEKAIVSEIPGTTRDFIEDVAMLGGIPFRFVDTAGLRQTDDRVESIGVARAYDKIRQAELVVYLFDAQTTTADELAEALAEIRSFGKPFLAVANKVDLLNQPLEARFPGLALVGIAAAQGRNLEALEQKLLEAVSLGQISSNTLITNARHHQALTDTAQSLEAVLRGLSDGTTSDFVALDIRHALKSLGQITGEIDIDRDILGTIFGHFCIGK